MKKIARLLCCLPLLTATSGCMQTATRYDPGVDYVQEYAQRSQTITLSAGNAKEANLAIHVIDPWPRYVGNKRIPANGQRMAGAVERYRDVSKLGGAEEPVGSGDTSAIDRGGSGGGKGERGGCPARSG
jgi:hypothetical protein